jgi:hypothetical protein
MSRQAGFITPAQFIAKWAKAHLPERAASHEHFIDLCRMLGQPTPAEHDATGAEYTFEKGVEVTGPASATSKGKYGFADVWWRDRFGWEYKTKDKHKDLTAAYRQLCQYREALGNPPAAGRLRHRSHHHPYQLHQHHQADSRNPARQDHRRPQPRHPPTRVHRSVELQTQAHA